MKPVAKSGDYNIVVEFGHQFQTQTRDIDVKGLILAPHTCSAPWVLSSPNCATHTFSQLVRETLGHFFGGTVLLSQVMLVLFNIL